MFIDKRENYLVALIDLTTDMTDNIIDLTDDEVDHDDDIEVIDFIQGTDQNDNANNQQQIEEQQPPFRLIIKRCPVE